MARVRCCRWPLPTAPCGVAESRGKHRGFSLLEAMVALVVLSSAGMVLFSWINASIVSLRRVEDANVRSAATINALEFMQSVNPMLRPQGSMDLGAYELRWQSRELTTPLDGADYPRGIGPFQIALYDTTVSLHQHGGAYWFEFNLQQVGHRRVRTAINPFTR